jgi:hypothetical protein
MANMRLYIRAHFFHLFEKRRDEEKTRRGERRRGESRRGENPPHDETEVCSAILLSRWRPAFDL